MAHELAGGGQRLLEGVRACASSRPGRCRAGRRPPPRTGPGPGRRWRARRPPPPGPRPGPRPRWRRPPRCRTLNRPVRASSTGSPRHLNRAPPGPGRGRGVAQAVGVQGQLTPVLQPGGQAPAPGVVGAHHRRGGEGGREQPRLGREVVVHRAVEVEVVLGQVGEHGHREAGGVHPVQLQAVGRHLHGHRPVARSRHPGQPGLQLGALGGGAGARQGPDDRARPAGGGEHRRQEVGHGRLAGRAGDAHHRQVPGTGGPRRRRPPGPWPPGRPAPPAGARRGAAGGRPPAPRRPRPRPRRPGRDRRPGCPGHSRTGHRR